MRKDLPKYVDHVSDVDLANLGHLRALLVVAGGAANNFSKNNISAFFGMSNNKTLKVLATKVSGLLGRSQTALPWARALGIADILSTTCLEKFRPLLSLFSFEDRETKKGRRKFAARKVRFPHPTTTFSRSQMWGSRYWDCETPNPKTWTPCQVFPPSSTIFTLRELYSKDFLQNYEMKGTPES